MCFWQRTESGWCVDKDVNEDVDGVSCVASVAHNRSKINKMLNAHSRHIEYVRQRHRKCCTICTCSRIFQSLVSYACHQFTVSFSSQFSVRQTAIALHTQAVTHAHNRHSHCHREYSMATGSTIGKSQNWLKISHFIGEAQRAVAVDFIQRLFSISPTGSSFRTYPNACILSK